jgi:arginyl-tRNA synthetase
MVASLLATTQVAGQLTTEAVITTLQQIVTQGATYGHVTPESAKRVLVEYVSADPNGPLTVGHARGGVVGDSLAALLTFAGHTVTREFYVNDATNSRQIERFAQALLHRYRLLLFEAGSFDGDVAPRTLSDYPEAYVTDIARKIIEQEGDRFLSLPEPDVLLHLQQSATRLIRVEQEDTLNILGLRFDNWFSETELHRHGAVQAILQRLKDAGYTYEQSSAVWLRSTAFGDASDRTLVRPDGTPTYLAGDLAYHADKFERGYEWLIDIWNESHATYIERTRAGLTALGYDANRLSFVLVGQVHLLKNGTEVRGTRMSGPDGTATLAEALPDIPAETMRLLLLKQETNHSLDMDADVVQRRDRTNPTAYLQDTLHRCRAFASEGSSVSSAGENGVKEYPAPLVEELVGFSVAVRQSAEHLAPDWLLGYALNLATHWHSVANQGVMLPLLAQATEVVLTNTLDILGVSPLVEPPIE